MPPSFSVAIHYRFRIIFFCISGVTFTHDDFENNSTMAKPKDDYVSEVISASLFLLFLKLAVDLYRLILRGLRYIPRILDGGGRSNECVCSRVREIWAWMEVSVNARYTFLAPAVCNVTLDTPAAYESCEHYTAPVQTPRLSHRTMPSFLAFAWHHLMGTDIGNSLENIMFFTAIAGPLLDLILGFIIEIYWMLSYELPFHILRLLSLITIADLAIGAFQTSFFAGHRGSPFNSKEYYRGLFAC
jgi:hypothetical protein